jgi:Fip1 motif
LDVDAVGNIDGTNIYEFNVDSLEDKPWLKPGADITDYFNYGFVEDTWRIYCERQANLRSENIVGFRVINFHVFIFVYLIILSFTARRIIPKWLLEE